MEKARWFEELWIWQQARLLVRQVYSESATGEIARDFEFRAQIRRASVSIMSNVAEGSGSARDSPRKCRCVLPQRQPWLRGSANRGGIEQRTRGLRSP